MGEAPMAISQLPADSCAPGVTKLLNRTERLPQPRLGDRLCIGPTPATMRDGIFTARYVRVGGRSRLAQPLLKRRKYTGREVIGIFGYFAPENQT